MSALFTGDYDRQILGTLRAIALTLENIETRITDMSSTLDDLKAQVEVNAEVEASAIQLIQNIADKLAAAGTDPVALAALTDELKNSSAALAAAIAANTPVDPTV
jgi:transcription initiation factor TFIIIB Brf1 subunit/transcription initiation factor TFIIB